MISSQIYLSHFLDLPRPPFDSVAFTPDGHVDADVLHALSSFEKLAPAHSSRIRSLRGFQFEHRNKKVGDLLRLVDAEVIFLP